MHQKPLSKKFKWKEEEFKFDSIYKAGYIYNETKEFNHEIKELLNKIIPRKSSDDELVL